MTIKHIKRNFTITEAIFAFIVFWLTFSPSVAAAETKSIDELKKEEAQSVRIHLDSETISKGYTAALPDSEFRLGVLPGVLSQTVSVRLQEIRETLSNAQGQKKLVSKVVEYDILGDENPLEIHKPLALTISFESDNYWPKRAYFWNSTSQEWLPLPSKTNWIDSHVEAISHLPFSRLAVFEDPAPLYGSAEFDYLSEDAVSGRIVSMPDGVFKLGWREGTMAGRTKVVLKGESVLPGPIPEAYKLVSPLMSFHVYHDGPIAKPIALELAYTAPNLNTKSLRYWDGAKETWVELPGYADFASERVHGSIHLPFAVVGVFEDASPQGQEGWASWYYSARYPNGAANNIFDYDTELKVTNLESGKSVVVKVVSRGPFVEGRVIDLSKDAFQNIAHPSKGVIHVRVEKIKSE